MRLPIFPLGQDRRLVNQCCNRWIIGLLASLSIQDPDQRGSLDQGMKSLFGDGDVASRRAWLGGEAQAL